MMLSASGELPRCLTLSEDPVIAGSLDRRVPSLPALRAVDVGPLTLALSNLSKGVEL